MYVHCSHPTLSPDRAVFISFECWGLWTQSFTLIEMYFRDMATSGVPILLLLLLSGNTYKHGERDSLVEETRQVNERHSDVSGEWPQTRRMTDSSCCVSELAADGPSQTGKEQRANLVLKDGWRRTIWKWNLKKHNANTLCSTKQYWKIGHSNFL